MAQHTLLIDGHNFLHRARAGFQGGDHSIVFTFMRNLRALVQQFTPDRVVMVMEGHPRHRYLLDAEYKANRVVEPGSERETQMADFHRQKRVVLSILCTCMPITIAKHPHYECDDTIYNLVADCPEGDRTTVVSNDSDFTQLLDEFENVSVWNPMKKEYVTAVPYDYVSWKALVGDGCDNIPGIPGIGPKRAAALLADMDKLEAFFAADEIASQTFIRNTKLIKFAPWSGEDRGLFESSQCDVGFIEATARLRTEFEKLGFQSLLVEKTWNKFIATFQPLFDKP